MRFYDVKNVRRLEYELDIIRIGAMKLYVNLPKYSKWSTVSNTARVKENVEASEAPFSQPKPKQQKFFLKPQQKVWRVKQTIKDKDQKLGDSKSGADWK